MVGGVVLGGPRAIVMPKIDAEEPARPFVAKRPAVTNVEEKGDMNVRRALCNRMGHVVADLDSMTCTRCGYRPKNAHKWPGSLADDDDEA